MPTITGKCHTAILALPFAILRLMTLRPPLVALLSNTKQIISTQVKNMNRFVKQNFQVKDIEG